jgi:methylsterol monooxygenase
MLLGILYGFGGVFFFSESFSSNLPSIWIFLTQMIMLLIFDDTYFYFYHLLLHKNKFLYRHIHSIHHRASAPYPLEFIYAHPLESAIAVGGILLGYISIYFIFGSINIYTFWAYSFVRIFHETDIHSGIKSLIFKWLPFYGSTQHHDAHHSHLHGNYASTFSFWDHILGTKIENKE